MDRETLLKEHPELADSLIAEGMAKAIVVNVPTKPPIVLAQNQAPENQAQQMNEGQAQNSIMDLLCFVLDAEQFAKVQKIVGVCDDIGMSYDKASALAPLLGVIKSNPVPTDQDIAQSPQSIEAQILANLQASGQSPLSGLSHEVANPSFTQKSALILDAERRK